MEQGYRASYESMLSASYFYAHPGLFYSFHFKMMVYPSSLFFGRERIIIDEEPTALDSHFDEIIRDDGGEVLSFLL